MTYLTGMPVSRMALAVPPDATKFSPSSCNLFANDVNPVLSETLRIATIRTNKFRKQYYSTPHFQSTILRT